MHQPFVAPLPLPPPLEFQPGVYAQDMIDAAETALEQLAEIASRISPIPIDITVPTYPEPPKLDMPEAPNFQAIDYSPPAIPATFTGTITIDDLIPDPFDEEAPTLNFGQAPTTFDEDAPHEPSVNTAFEDLGTLTVNMPVAPSLLSLNIVPFEGMTMPVFDAVAPEIDLTAPSIVPFVPGSDYSSSLMSLLRSTFLTRITDGGTGLSVDVENAIWDRGREREVKAKREAILNLERMEAMGFAFPPGVYLDARLKIETETQAAIAGHSREVMIKQAELEQTNIQKSLEQAVQLEGKYLDLWNSTEQRRFETAKYSTEAQISIFNARVQAFNAMNDAYKAKVSVFEARVRAETAKVDAYRAQIAAESAKAEVNTALIQQYKVQSDIALSAIEIYKARGEAIRVRAEIEKLKIDIYREQIAAFTGKISAYTAKVEAYKAVVGAEAAKQDAFRSVVQAYSAEVDAAVKVISTRVDEFKARISVKESEFEAYKATVQGEVARTQALASFNSALAEQYKAEISASNAFNDAITKQWQTTIEALKGTTEIQVAIAKANSEISVSSLNVALEAAKAAGVIAAQIGAAALSAYNISSSQSFANSNSNTNSASDSVSESDSKSESKGESTSHNYNDSDSRSQSTSVNENTSYSRSVSWANSWSDTRQWPVFAGAGYTSYSRNESI